MVFKLTRYAKMLLERQELKEKMEKEAAEKAEKAEKAEREKILAEEMLHETESMMQKRAESIERNEEQMRKWEERKNAISEMARRLEEKYGQSFLPGLGPKTSWGTSVPVGNLRNGSSILSPRTANVDRIPEGHLSSERIDAFENAEFKFGGTK